MAFQVSPGVQVKELDLTTIIPTIATTPSGFVGLFEWGPANEVVTVSSENELRQVFGEPNDVNAAWWFTASSFLRYGSNLQVVRGESADGSKNAGQTGGVTNAFPIPFDLTSQQDGSGPWANANYDEVGTFFARYPGKIGNSVGVAVWDSAAEGTDGEDSGTFANWGPAGATGLWASYIAGGTPDTSQAALNRAGTGGINDEMHIIVFDANGDLTGTRNTPLEIYEGVSKATDAKLPDGSSNYYRTKINNNSEWLIVGRAVEGGSGAAGFEKTISEVWTSGAGGSGGSFGAFFDPNGAEKAKLRNGLGLSGGSSEGEIGGGGRTTDIQTQYRQHFADAEENDVSFIISGPADANLANDLVSIAEQRKDCIVTLSPELNDVDRATDQVNQILEYRNTINPKSSYAVLDSGWKVVYDPYRDTYRKVPLNGDIAGLMVRSDEDFEPWFSPAGFNRGTLRNVVKLVYSPSKTERDQLYVKGVNPVVNFENEGIVLFGDKTMLAKPSAFDRINVRRLFNILQKSIATAARFSLFEFNDTFTRNAFKNLVEPFLRDVQARRGVQDFKVVCDESNNTPTVIDRNEFVADIFIKPSRSINFITLNFIATPTGVNFEEIGA